MIVVVWAAAIFFTVLTFPAIKECILRIARPSAHHAVGFDDWFAPLILSGMNLFLLGAAGYVALQRIRFGSSRLELSTFPGAVGGKLAGTIVTSKPVQFTSELHLTLTCRKLAGYRGNANETLWRDELILTSQVPTDGQTSRIPIYFEIPSHCLPTQRGKALIRWRLKVRSAMPGVDYYARFIVPVFKVDQETEVADLTQPYRAAVPQSPEPDSQGSESRANVH
ncbi:MAG TPA: hypothetical protein VHS31_18495 [Tepidisphaeraceae bacterium]|nr:hypothetical protein [Tepidisphaeraceae bacterium]